MRGSQLLKRAVASAERRRPWRVLDRPVFIIAPPRSGSTLLQDLLGPHPDLAAWPSEAHEAYDRARPPGHPRSLGHRWPPEYATPAVRRALSRELYLGRLRARQERGLPVHRTDRLALHKVRLLEKTPASVLRVEALAALYPDAKLVFLHRDAPATIGSLLESWDTPSSAHVGFVHEGRRVTWMMLAPPGWIDRADDPVAERAAFQWRAGVEAPLDALEQLPPERWMRVSYEELVSDPEPVLRRILAYAELSADPDVLAEVHRIGQAGRTSLSAPQEGKWKARSAEIEPLLPALADIRRRLGYV